MTVLFSFIEQNYVVFMAHVSMKLGLWHFALYDFLSLLFELNATVSSIIYYYSFNVLQEIAKVKLSCRLEL